MKDYIKNRNFLTRIIVFALIIVVFHSVYGLEIIIPTNINWIMSSRHDWATHYLGWAFYRYEPWTFPLGDMNTAIYPIGTNVGFFDNAPGMSILLKLFSPLLPEDFQYLGFWLLFCFIMAGHFIIKIFTLYNVKPLYVVLGTLLIACNPVLVYRGMHPALCAHFLIIASIYLYLKPASHTTAEKINRQQLLLIIISALINPYLCFMVAGFNVILPLKHYLYGRFISLKKTILYPLFSFISVVGVWVIIGMIKLVGNSGLKVKGSYSLYGFNLNSLTNSGGFSIYLPQKPYVTPYQYEGYMYLGLGIILLLAITIIYFFIKAKKTVFNTKNKYLLPLLFFSIAALLFAITNVVTYNDQVLFKYWMPKLLLEIGNTFRACGRVSWIPYYCGLLFIMLLFCKSHIKDWIKLPLLIFVIFIQGYDMQNLYIREDYPYGSYDTPLTEEKWNAIIPSFKAMITYPPFNNHLLTPMDYQDLSFLALKNHKPITMGYTGRHNYTKNEKYTTILKTRLSKGNFSPDELYITTAEHLNDFKFLLSKNELALEYLDGYYILYDKTKQDKIKFDREVSLLYKIDSEKAYNNTELVKAKYIDSLNTDILTFKLDRLITNENSIVTAGSVFMENYIDGKKDSVFVTVSDSNRMFIIQPNQIQSNTTDKAGLEFSSIILTNGFELDSLILGIAMKKSSGEWLYNKIGKLSKIKKTTRSIKKDNLPPQKAQMGVIDNITEKDKTIEFYGWTAFKDMDATDSEVEVVFIDNNNIYTYSSTIANRFDVTEAYNRVYDYDNSGFRALIDKKDIPNGNYKIGLLVRNKSTGEESLMMTDKTFIKQ